MAKITCKEGSGREYVLALGTAVIREMSPSAAEGIPPELMAKLVKFGTDQGVTKAEDLDTSSFAEKANLTEDEVMLLAKIEESDIVEMLKICLRTVSGVLPEKVVNEDTGKEYGSIEAFLDEDELLVDDIPELSEIIASKLVKYYSGVMKQGELKGFFETGIGEDTLLVSPPTISIYHAMMKTFGWTFDECEIQAENHPDLFVECFMYIGALSKYEKHLMDKSTGKHKMSDGLKGSSDDIDQWKKNTKMRHDSNMAGAEAALQKKFGNVYNKM